MGKWVAALVCILSLAMLALPAQAGTESNPEIRDPPGDVTRGFTEPVSDELADALDILQVWFTKDSAGQVWSHTKVLDLSGIAHLRETPSFSAQYGVSFTGTDGPYQLSVLVGGTTYGPDWRCSVARHGEWTQTAGYIDVPRGIMHVQMTQQAAAAFTAGPATRNLDAQAWGSLQDSDAQTDDWASTPVPYIPALDPAQAPFSTEGLVPCGSAPVAPSLPIAGEADLGDTYVTDPADDVVMTDANGTQPTHDDLAKSLDLLAVSFTRDPQGDYWGHIRLTDLIVVAGLASQDHFSVQYAVDLLFDGHARFELRANTGGSDYSDPAGSWRCNSYDEDTNEWPQTVGYVDAQRGVIHIRVPSKPSALLASGQSAHDLGASAWGSTSDSSRPQTADWAQSRVVLHPANLTEAAAPSGSNLVACGALNPEKSPDSSPSSTATATNRPSSSTAAPTSERPRDAKLPPGVARSDVKPRESPSVGPILPLAAIALLLLRRRLP